MIKTMPGLVVAGATLLTLALVTPSLAREPNWDRVESRVDRAENRYDALHDYGRRDLIEDRADRIEDRFDAHGVEISNPFDRHERRSWRRALRAE